METPEGVILAFDCPCGEPVDLDDVALAIVKWDDPVSGISHSICHVNCLTKEDNE